MLEKPGDLALEPGIEREYGKEAGQGAAKHPAPDDGTGVAFPSPKYIQKNYVQSSNCSTGWHCREKR